MRENQFSITEQIVFRMSPIFPFKKTIIKLLNSIRFKKIQNLKTPINLLYYVTNRCNFRCKHCFYWKKLNQEKNELNLKQIAKVVKSLKHPLNMVSITGGEPTLRKNLVEICNLFYKINKTKRINISTNGFLTGFICKSTKRILKENPNKRLTIFISVDGLEKTNDSMRGIKGSFKKTIQTIKELKKIKNKNLTIMVATTICNQNYKELPQIIKLIKKFKVVHKFNLLRDNSNVYGIDKSILHDFDPKFSKLPNLDELEVCYKRIKLNSKTISSKVEALKIRHFMNTIKNKKSAVKCLARFTDCVIFPEGDVSICESTKPYGNLKETNYDLCKLWNTNKAKAMKCKLKECSCLFSFNLLNSMKYDNKSVQRLLK